MLHQEQQCDIGLEDATFEPEPSGGLYLGTWWWRWWPIPSENFIQHLFMFLCMWVSSRYGFAFVWGWGERDREDVGCQNIPNFLVFVEKAVQILLNRRTTGLGRKFVWGYFQGSCTEGLEVSPVHSRVENPIRACRSWKWFIAQTRNFFEAPTLICPLHPVSTADILGPEMQLSLSWFSE